MLAQADRLEVEENDCRTIADLLVLISASSFTEAMRSQLRVTHAVLVHLELLTFLKILTAQRLLESHEIYFGHRLRY